MSAAGSNAGALIGHRMGKYELVALLALGGTAEIYLARIGGVAGFEKYVVVKCLHDHLADDSEFVRMFLDEARLTAQLDHSNIVQTIELGEERGRYYIVMEYLAGMSLSLIARRAVERVPGGRLPVDLTLCLAAQACAGLHYAHQRTDMSGAPLNIVHRDVSPQNLVVSFEGIVKLVDFGIAKAEMRNTATRSGTVKGKFAYMSPEQCTAGHVDHRTDVFAMGVVVHELLTGKRLFKRPSTYDTYRAIVESQTPAPSEMQHELDPALDEVVMRALARDRDQRYPSAEAFGEALARALHRRGQAVSAGLVATFFEQHFAKEMREHAERMRALISGRQTAVEEQWDEPDASSDVGNPERPFDSMSHTLDMAVHRQHLAHLSTAEAPPPGAEGEDIDGGATRVEMNPLLQGAAFQSPELLRDPEPGSQRRSSLPLPPEPETFMGGGMAPGSGGRKSQHMLVPGQPPAQGNTTGEETLALGFGEVAKPRRPTTPVPAPPRLPEPGAVARGRAPSPSDFAMAKTSPAGPQGIRGQRPASEPGDIGEDDTPPDHLDGNVRSGAYAAAPDPALAHAPMERPVYTPGEWPMQAPLDRPASGPLDRLGSGAMERIGSGAPGRMSPRGPGSGGLSLAQRGVPYWFLVVLFVLSVGVGLGATLLVHRLL
jgi:serine/threonine protein kinase